MLLWVARIVLLRRFGGRGLVILGLLNFVRRRFASKTLPRGPYQPSQGSSQTVQRRPR